MEDTNRGQRKARAKGHTSESFRVFHLYKLIETDTIKHGENISDAHLRIIAFNNSCI